MKTITLEVYKTAEKLPLLSSFGQRNEHRISEMLVLRLRNGKFIKGKYVQFEGHIAGFVGVDIGHVGDEDVVEWCEFPFWD